MKWVKRLSIIFLSLIVIAIVLLYVYPSKQQQVDIGLNFDNVYAQSLDLHWRDVYLSALVELQPKHISVPAFWSEVESIKGIYTYTDVDWMLSEASKRNIKTTLIIGQKGRRGVECRIPKWVEGEQHTALLAYVSKTVERYTEHPSLEMIQIEVEPFVPFIKDCPQYVERVADITTIVKESNSRQQVVVSDNAETGSLQRASKHADVLGLSIFRSRKGTDGQVFTYNWLSTNMYKVKLAWSKVSQQKMLISALQGEPWFTSINMIYTPLQEQEKTMTVSILNDQLNIASQLVTSRVYIDGVEWWYFMKVNNGIDVYWNLVMKMLLS